MPKAEPLFSDARVGDWLRIPVNTWDYVWVPRADLINSTGVKVPQKTVELPLAITQPNIALMKVRALRRYRENYD